MNYDLRGARSLLLLYHLDAALVFFAHTKTRTTLGIAKMWL